MTEIPILLLAAGGSNRMGKAKQLLPWGKSTLIEHQIHRLLETGNPVLVVLGHLGEQISSLLEPYPVATLVHKHWDKGMGSSISLGIREMEKLFPKAKGAMIAQLDQPLITASHYTRLVSNFQSGLGQIIVSRSSSGWEGVPVLFDREYFKELQELKGEEGARKIFRSHSRAVIVIDSQEVLDDMDSPETYEELLAKYKA